MQHKKRVFFNSLTDTGFLFEIGNSLIGFAVSFIAGLISLSIAVLCYTARFLAELRKSKQSNVDIGSSSNFLLKLANIMSKNIGASLMISGSALLLAAFFALLSPVFTIHFELTNLAHFKEGFILFCFGFANFVRGYARSLQNLSFQQKILDVTGITFAAIGVLLTGSLGILEGNFILQPEYILDVFVKSLFVLAVIFAVKESFLNSISFIKPDLLFAVGCIGNAYLAPSVELKIANMLFAIAFVSLHALKHKNGLYEYLIKN